MIFIIFTIILNIPFDSNISNNKLNIIILTIGFFLSLGGAITTFINTYRYLIKIFEKEDGPK